MFSMRPIVLAGVLCHPLAAWSAETERDTLSQLFVVFLFLFSLIMLFTSIPRALREGVVSHEVLQAFAHSRGLAEETVARPESLQVGAETVRRWRSDNPALKRPAPGTVVFRGMHGGYPFLMDEVWVSGWLGGVRRREPMLRMAVELPDLPATLEVAPGGMWMRLTGRAGLLEPRLDRPRRGRLVAIHSRRPVLRAKERIFLTRERRRILEEFEAQAGGVHIADGRLFVIRPRLTITAPDLAAMYDDIGALAQRLATSG